MKDVTIYKLQKISNDWRLENWYYAYLSIWLSDGHRIITKSFSYHKSFWLKEFNLTEDDFNKIEIIDAPTSTL